MNPFSTTVAHTAKHFVRDPADPSQFLCLECREEINEALSEFRDEDDGHS